jgi:hypothetical protein
LACIGPSSPRRAHVRARTPASLELRLRRVDLRLHQPGAVKPRPRPLRVLLRGSRSQDKGARENDLAARGCLHQLARLH